MVLADGADRMPRFCWPRSRSTRTYRPAACRRAARPPGRGIPASSLCCHDARRGPALYRRIRHPPRRARYGVVERHIAENRWPRRSRSSPTPAGRMTTPSAWQGEGLRLETPQTSEPDRKQGDDIAAAHIPDLPDWADTPAPEEPEPPRPLAPSRSTLPEPAARSPLAMTAVSRSSGVCWCIGCCRPCPISTSPTARVPLGHFWRVLACTGCRPDRRVDFGNDGRAGRSCLCRPVRSGSRAEVPVAGVVGGTAVSGRIDRLVIGPCGVKILDFKTNRPPPALPEDVPLCIPPNGSVSGLVTGNIKINRLNALVDGRATINATERTTVGRP